jgi:hypothetical protein
MLTSTGVYRRLHVDVYIIKLRNTLQSPLNRSAITFLKSSTSTSYFSNSTRSSALALGSPRLLLQPHQNMCINRPHTSELPILKEDESQSLNACLIIRGERKNKLLSQKKKMKKKKIPRCCDKLINSRCMHKNTKMLGSCYYLNVTSAPGHCVAMMVQAIKPNTSLPSTQFDRMSGHKVCMRVLFGIFS